MTNTVLEDAYQVNPGAEYQLGFNRTNHLDDYYQQKSLILDYLVGKLCPNVTTGVGATSTQTPTPVSSLPSFGVNPPLEIAHPYVGDPNTFRTTLDYSLNTILSQTNTQQPYTYPSSHSSTVAPVPAPVPYPTSHPQTTAYIAVTAPHSSVPLLPASPSTNKTDSSKYKRRHSTKKCSKDKSKVSPRNRGESNRMEKNGRVGGRIPERKDMKMLKESVYVTPGSFLPVTRFSKLKINESELLRGRGLASFLESNIPICDRIWKKEIIPSKYRKPVKTYDSSIHNYTSPTHTYISPTHTYSSPTEANPSRTHTYSTPTQTNSSPKQTYTSPTHNDASTSYSSDVVADWFMNPGCSSTTSSTINADDQSPSNVPLPSNHCLTSESEEEEENGRWAPSGIGDLLNVIRLKAQGASCSKSLGSGSKEQKHRGASKISEEEDSSTIDGEVDSTRKGSPKKKKKKSKHRDESDHRRKKRRLEENRTPTGTKDKNTDPRMGKSSTKSHSQSYENSLGTVSDKENELSVTNERNNNVSDSSIRIKTEIMDEGVSVKEEPLDIDSIKAEPELDSKSEKKMCSYLLENTLTVLNLMKKDFDMAKPYAEFLNLCQFHTVDRIDPNPYPSCAVWEWNLKCFAVTLIHRKCLDSQTAPVVQSNVSVKECVQKLTSIFEGGLLR